MSTVKSIAAEALAPMLDPFHLIGEQALRSVWQVNTHALVERLILVFEGMSLSVFADENDDSIDLAVGDAVDLRDLDVTDISSQEQWNTLVGKSFGWGWVTINQQGYCDGLLLSFGGIIPDIVLNVMASSISTRKIADS